MHRRQGFTLIEMSIVLVIIGLIIGGVLAGRELIHSAMLRKQITQIEQYNTAVNTFIGKYNTFPGDLSPSEASRFGFAARSGDPGHGDKNGILDQCEPGNPLYYLYDIGCEKLLFWGDLSNAKMITENLSANTDDTMIATSAAASAAFNPSTKLKKDAVLIATRNVSGDNVYLASGYFTNGTGAYLGNEFFSTSIDSFNLDVKMDDGKPLSGSVKTVDPGVSLGSDLLTKPATNGSCIQSSAYLLSGVNAVSFPICALTFNIR